MDQDIGRLLADIDAACVARADPKQVAKYARYFREGFDAYGVHWEDPGWETLRTGWFDAHRSRGLKWFLDLGKTLFSTGKYEHGALAIDFLKRVRGEFRAGTLTGIGKWFEGGVRNWAHSDVICGELLAPCLAEGVAGLEVLASWRSSRHKFKRRAVPVAMLGLLKATSDYRPLLEFLRPLMLDPERVVQQGLGWFLREAWKLQRKPVESFLLEWKDSAPRLIFQYATEKMTPQQKQRFKKAKAAAAS
jgi:3-methyladenine DNA glycosylase AlkD